MGNWLYKEWSEINYDELSDTCKQKNKTKRKSLANVGAGKELSELARHNSVGNSTPVTNKVLVADFDPRSPTSGIPRTPICYLNEANEKKKHLPPMIDPRSPTNEYNRTPIHCNSNKKGNHNADDLNSSLFNDSVSSCTQDQNPSDSILTNDGSMYLQQVPDSPLANAVRSPLTNNNLMSNESPNGKTVGTKTRKYNNPSHILQRKQVKKLNQNKLIDQDKENQC